MGKDLQRTPWSILLLCVDCWAFPQLWTRVNNPITDGYYQNPSSVFFLPVLAGPSGSPLYSLCFVPFNFRSPYQTGPLMVGAPPTHSTPGTPSVGWGVGPRHRAASRLPLGRHGGSAGNPPWRPTWATFSKCMSLG